MSTTKNNTQSQKIIDLCNHLIESDVFKTKQAIAKEIDISSQNLYNVLNRKILPSMDVLQKIHDNLGVNMNYLFGRSDQMFLSDLKAAASEEVSIYQGLFALMQQEHGLSLIESQMDDIIHEVEKIFYKKNKNLKRPTFFELNGNSMSSENIYEDLKLFITEWNTKQSTEETCLYFHLLCSKPK